MKEIKGLKKFKFPTSNANVQANQISSILLSHLIFSVLIAMSLMYFFVDSATSNRLDYDQDIIEIMNLRNVC